jgi:hypothetical protein
MNLLERQLRPLDGGTPAEMEEAVRLLGEAFGFEASRPDNEFDTGPDVLWLDSERKLALGLELKTDKQVGSTFNKADVSQSLDHLSWMRDNTGGSGILGITLVGPSEGVSESANPVPEIFSIKPQALAELRDRLLATIRDLYKGVPAQLPEMIANTFGDGWGLDSLSGILCAKSLKQGQSSTVRV